ncbi:hypothetical protein [Saccharopolyspora spinosa]|uniref:hypothetical protein n=1 Tax=Saccharopolyspora spinosa TaxID=60894 RepID=UPI0037481170
MTEEQATELAGLQPKAQQKQQRKETKAKYNQRLKDAADRVAELEELAGRGSCLRSRRRSWRRSGRRQRGGGEGGRRRTGR